MGKYRRFPRQNKPMASGYALTVKVVKGKQPRKNCKALLKQPYVKYVVWCVEYGNTNYHHMHIHVEHKIKLHRSNRYYDEVLGAHPYLQRVGTSPMDKRRLWDYYMKEGDWDCLAINGEHQKRKEKIKKEVSSGVGIS